ncbi:Spermidine synthase [Paraburkholderia tropica]|uniref:fused MFS/spermidine synthase n=1 Tax=Paraburkholderia tropica TaxID=92647 RepID=UPI001CADE017|nr:fused MFS/spermidine synthase [Paraburkholderia tropica]CAG9228696.1 Spermidine synthase [Paraburkholderia tropica]
MIPVSTSPDQAARRERRRDAVKAAAFDPVQTRALASPVSLALLLFFSGCAALVYQVLWVRQLALVVGIDVHAVTTGVSAFFGGLALGSALFGARADRNAHPLRLYALLEAATLVLAPLATFGLAHAAAPFAAIEARAGALAWVVPFLLVGLPAIPMGGTLPVLARVIGDARQGGANGVAKRGGWLYAANTAGAVLGTLAASFVLIPLLGVQMSACAAALLNAVAGGVALLLARGNAATFSAMTATSATSAAGATAASTVNDADTNTAAARLAVTLYALAGGVALGYEVVWSQAIVQFISTRAFAFSVVLATYLLGLALGSACASRHAARTSDPWSRFATLIVAAGLVALLEIAAIGAWLPHAQTQLAQTVMSHTGSLLAAMCARFALAALVVVFVPTLLLGAAFPFAVRLGAQRGRVGHSVGALLALNTAGGIAGAVLAGFVLVPALGLVRALAVLAIAAAALGVIAVINGPDVRRVGRWAVGALVLGTACAALLTPPDRFATLLARTHGGTLSAYEESAGSTVAVLEQSAGEHRFKRLYIQGVSNSGDAMTSQRYMRLQALLPLLIDRQTPRSALVIGLGTGITGGALLAYPGLEQRVIAELLPAVVRAAPRFAGNFDVTRDPRVQIHTRDGRRELLSSAQRYDLITLEPPPPSAAGVANLYSTDFYALAAARLQPGGLVAQWLPLATQNEDDTRALIRSFTQVFPYATLWTTELHETLLIGSMQPIELNVPRIRARFENPSVSEALRAVGIASPAALLATYVTDRAGLEYYAADARPVTDDRPRIEYARWPRREAFPQTLSHMMELRSTPPLVGADAAFLADLAQQGAVLETFYHASLDAYSGNRDGWSQSIEQVIGADPHNPYYRWFTGDTE